MKILYHHRIASKDGQYVHVEELTNAFLQAGHELLFVCPEFADKADFGDEGGIATKLKAKLPRSIYEILELGYSLLIAVKLIVAILKFKPDFIYERYNLYQPVGVIIARLFKLPILLEVNAPLVQERSKYSGLALPRFAKFIENFTWRKASFVLPVTQVLAQHVYDAGVPEERVVVVPNGINEKVIAELDKRAAEREQSKDIVIGFTGFINPWHKLDKALDAIAQIGNKKIKFICVGEGDIRPQLEQQAKTLGIQDQVMFTGLVNREKVFDYVAQFDIALQPSVTEYASPLKLFEYLASASLVIAPDMPNIREILDETNSLLFKPDEPDDFKNKLVDALENFENYKSVRMAARAAIDQQGLTWQNNAERVINLLDKPN
jgi:glycosyltransferase involved in cell wall biosynthesis